MPLRSVKMKRFIFGFQRRVWCPKWTPLSSSSRIVTTAMAVSPWCSVVRGGRVTAVPDAPARCLRMGPGTVSEDRDARPPNTGGGACEVDPVTRIAPEVYGTGEPAGDTHGPHAPPCRTAAEKAAGRCAG
ncbi:hypothetical protein GCM10010420_24830 [Streptomyces glaucosporus]|uniref:Uncharacterized protein n=1 Tax=Streptomyces glaucosporus TaxID=284044 RepID=A0ABP5VA78_9ACTN